MSIRKTLIESLDEICSQRARVFAFTHYDESIRRPYGNYLAVRILQYCGESWNTIDYVRFPDKSFGAVEIEEQHLKNNFPLFVKSYVY